MKKLFIIMVAIGAFLLFAGSALSIAGDTHLSLSARTNMGVGATIPVEATLYEGNGAAYGAIEGAPLSFSADGIHIATVATNQYGKATASASFATAGSHLISVSYSGSEAHPAVNASVVVSIVEAPSGGEQVDESEYQPIDAEPLIGIAVIAIAVVFRKQMPW